MRISPMMGWCGIPPSSGSCHEHDPGNCACVSWPHHAFVVGRYLFWDKIGAARVWAPERTLHLLPSGGRGVLVFEAGLSGRNGHLCPSRTRAHAGSPWCNRHGSRQAIRGRGRGQDWTAIVASGRHRCTVTISPRPAAALSRAGRDLPQHRRRRGHRGQLTNAALAGCFGTRRYTKSTKKAPGVPGLQSASTKEKP
jgi:hypothetical protein